MNEIGTVCDGVSVYKWLMISTGLEKEHLEELNSNIEKQ
jgi:hypothetical protein